MAVLTTGNTFANGDQVTSATLNSAVNNATFASGAVDNTSTQLSSGAIIVKDLGVTEGKIATGAVTTAKIASDVVINTSGNITGAAGAFTTLTASDDANFDSGTLFVDASADSVGIGTVSPSSTLHIENTTSSGAYINYDGQSNTEFGLRVESNASGGNFESDFDNGGTALLDLYANSASVSGGDILVARTQSAAPVLLVKGNGNVGIGTASPSQLLDVNGSARTTGNFFVGTDDTTPNGMIEVYGGGTGQDEGGEIRLRTGADYDTTYNHYFIDAYQDDFRIGRAGAADITLTSDGNVGIGTTTPQSKLDITSTTSGVLLPRMTTTQMNAISSPANGEIIYNTTASKFYGYAGGAWVALH